MKTRIYAQENKGIRKLQSNHFFHPKLNINRPNKMNEQIRDVMPEKVMRMPNKKNENTFFKPANIFSIHRKCGHCEVEEKLQLKENSSTEASVGSYVENLNNSGKPLPESSRKFFEPRFGYDFSNVKIHNDSTASNSAQNINALAYTTGNNIVFNQNQYSPETNSGKKLLAHELTHVLQQNIQHNDIIMRAWDSPENSECDFIANKHLEKVVVNQEQPQAVTLLWSDGSNESSVCSAGKGTCCLDDTNAGSVSCTVPGSHIRHSNCTPITSGGDHLITDRSRHHEGHQYWNTFEPHRAIALHDYPIVTGNPLSHGCVRLHEDTAKKIFCGGMRYRTRVEVHGFPTPRCDDKDLIAEWRGDFASAIRTPSDGDSPEIVQTIYVNRLESRRALNLAYGHRLTETELNLGIEGIGIPRCNRRSR